MDPNGDYLDDNYHFMSDFDDYDDGYEPPERTYYVYADLTREQQLANEKYVESDFFEKEALQDIEYSTEDSACEAAAAISLFFTDTLFTVWSCYYTRFIAPDDGGDQCDERVEYMYLNGELYDPTKKGGE